MKMRLLFTATAMLVALCAGARTPLEYVNPMIGTDAHGHTYPGATVPFGMVQLSPDNGKSGWDWCSGYHYSCDTLVGFSHTHLSGTGCADLGDILFLPLPGVNTTRVQPFARFSHDEEEASPGYYSVRLQDSGIRAELTATERAGFHRYGFPRGAEKVIAVDLGYGQDDSPTDTYIRIDGPTQMSGHRISAGWAREQHIYFAAEFSLPIAAILLNADDQWLDGASEGRGKTARAILTFSDISQVLDGNQPLLAKVGISPVSIEGARRNLEAEVPHWDFEAVRESARAAWAKELNVVEVQSTSEADKETFYTALYHSMLAPTLFGDADGQYRGGDNQLHQADKFDNHCTFSLWDTYRAAHPLYTIIQPKRVPEFVQSMLAFYRESGLLPVWSLTGNETWCMIGYHSVPVIVDAYMKGFQGFDADEALAAMKKSAMQHKRGLEYYNLVLPQPLDNKLAELNRGIIPVPDSLRRAAVAGDRVVPGWARSVSGDVINYHSSYPYVKNALLVRATDGTMKIEWETAPVPAELQADTVTFMWVAGLCTFRGGHRFDLYANGEHWLSFNSARDTTEKFWSAAGRNGTTLTFLPTYVDVFDDFFGEAYLKVPARLLQPGQPLNLRVEGENGGSSDWYMTFEHESRDTVSVEQEYAVGEWQGQRYYFLQLRVESLTWQARTPMLVTDPGGLHMESTSLRIAPGLTCRFVPVDAVDSPVAGRIHGLYDAAAGAEPGYPPPSTPIIINPVVPYGYIPADRERESVSKALEYAYDDWCIAQMAKALGKPDDHELFSRRAMYYRNLYDAETGFMRGRNADGSWVSPFDPRFGTEKQPEYTEGNAWQYSWYVPHDVPGLIELMGGREQFAEKLDLLFQQSSDLAGAGATADMTGLLGMYAHGNEPSHHIAYLYNYAGQPWKTQEVVHRICREFYTSRADGLCGNEDCGQMSAWYVFSAMGFYPVNPADGTYQIGTPLMEKVTVRLENGKKFTVLANKVSGTNIYVQSVKLNGKPHKSTVITHADIMRGGTLEFTMGPKPGRWGTGR